MPRNIMHSLRRARESCGPITMVTTIPGSLGEFQVSVTHQDGHQVEFLQDALAALTDEERRELQDMLPAGYAIPCLPQAEPAPAATLSGTTRTLSRYEARRSGMINTRFRAARTPNWTARGNIQLNLLSAAGYDVTAGNSSDLERALGMTLQTMVGHLEQGLMNSLDEHQALQERIESLAARHARELDVFTARAAEAAKLPARLERLAEAATAWRDKGKTSTEKLALFEEMMAIIDALPRREEAPAEQPAPDLVEL